MHAVRCDAWSPNIFLQLVPGLHTLPLIRYHHLKSSCCHVISSLSTRVQLSNVTDAYCIRRRMVKRMRTIAEKLRQITNRLCLKGYSNFRRHLVVRNVWSRWNSVLEREARDSSVYFLEATFVQTAICYRYTKISEEKLIYFAHFLGNKCVLRFE